MEFFNDMPGQVFALENAVLSFQVGVGNVLDLKEFLNGGNVRVFLLDLDQRTGFVDSFLFQRGEQHEREDDEKNRQNRAATFLCDAPVFQQVRDVVWLASRVDGDAGALAFLQQGFNQRRVGRDLLVRVHARLQG